MFAEQILALVEDRPCARRLSPIPDDQDVGVSRGPAGQLSVSTLAGTGG